MNHHRGIRVSSVAGLACCVLVLGVLFGGCTALDDSSSLPPTPVGALSNNNSPIVPSTSGPSYVEPIQWPGPAVFHWEQMSFVRQANPADPFEDKQVFGDIWLRLGRNGQPIQYEATYTLSDGTPVQQIFQDGAAITVREVHPPGLLPNQNQPTCDVSTSAAPAGGMGGLLPVVVDPNMLRQLGYAATTRKAVALPPLKPLDGVSPANILPAADVQTLEQRRTLDNGNLHVAQISFDSATLRSLGVDNITLTSSGSVVSEFWTTYGSISIYHDGDVPASQFDPKTLEPCQ